MTRNRRVAKWSHLHPRTSTGPILLEEYVRRESRDRVVNHDKLNPEWMAWHDRMTAKYGKDDQDE